MKHILGLDLGSNSIGWAFVQQDFENKQGKIIWLLVVGLFLWIRGY